MSTPRASMKIQKLPVTYACMYILYIYIYIHVYVQTYTHIFKVTEPMEKIWKKPVSVLRSQIPGQLQLLETSGNDSAAQKLVSSKGRSSSRLSASPFTCLWVAYHSTLGDGMYVSKTTNTWLFHITTKILMLSRFCNRDRIKKKKSASRLKPILHHLCSRTQTFDCNTVLNKTGGDASWVELRPSTTLIKLAHSFLTCTSDSAVYKSHHRSHRSLEVRFRPSNDELFKSWSTWMKIRKLQRLALM